MSQPTNSPLAEILAQAIANSSIAPQLEAMVSKLHDSVSNFISTNPNFLENVQRFFEEARPERQREIWSKAASQGWYLNSETSNAMKWEALKGQDALDAFMAADLRADWPILTESIISAYPDRKEILDCAFQLHSEGRYIASIPLFFSQADGICAQVIGAHLFTDKSDRETKLNEISANSEPFIDILLGLLSMPTQFNAGISKSTAKHKSLAPNRNGILHGSRKHLDYGTEINSLKAFSLLAFVVFIFSQVSVV